MREESHLDEMRAAIRGDFERLERRRGAQELLHVSEPPVEPEEPEERHEPDESGAPNEPALGLEESRAPNTLAPVPPPERSWLDRMLGR